MDETLEVREKQLPTSAVGGPGTGGGEAAGGGARPVGAFSGGPAILLTTATEETPPGGRCVMRGRQPPALVVVGLDFMGELDIETCMHGTG